MDEIKHKFIEVNGLKLHVAEIGSESSPVVVFLHGFPEIWYSWRYQMIAMAKAGFRAIAFDFRGYGLSDKPTEPEKTTYLDLINDLLGLLNAFSIQKVYLIGKDFGAFIISYFVLLHEDRVSGFVTMGVPFMLPGPFEFDKFLPEGFYLSRWREPRRAEADFGRFDAKTVVKNIYILFSKGEIPIADEKQEIMDLVEPGTPLPFWFSEEDLAIYGALYEKSGFQTALQVPYRYQNACIPMIWICLLAVFCFSLPHSSTHAHKRLVLATYLEFETEVNPGSRVGEFRMNDLIMSIHSEILLHMRCCSTETTGSVELAEPLIDLPQNRAMGEQLNMTADPKVKVPALLLMGEKDYVLKFPGIEDYIRSGNVKSLVPTLEIVFMPEGTHFVQEQLPDEVNQLLLSFLHSKS